MDKNNFFVYMNRKYVYFVKTILLCLSLIFFRDIYVALDLGYVIKNGIKETTWHYNFYMYVVLAFAKAATCIWFGTLGIRGKDEPDDINK